jgi:hypothetical protein
MAYNNLVRKPPAFNMLNNQLKSITGIEPVPGFRIDLTTQISRHLQLGGMWEYNKKGSGFALNTALAVDPLSQENTYVAATYHHDGKMESKGLLNLGWGFNLNGEAMFPSPDPRRAFWAAELGKSFDNCYAGVKCGTGMRSFNFIQTIFNNCYAGFECTYMPHLRDYFWNLGAKMGLGDHTVFTNYMPTNPNESLSLGYMFSVLN